MRLRLSDSKLKELRSWLDEFCTWEHKRQRASENSGKKKLQRMNTELFRKRAENRYKKRRSGGIRADFSEKRNYDCDNKNDRPFFETANEICENSSDPR